MRMLQVAKHAMVALGMDPKAFYLKLSARSLKAAIREQGLADLCNQLRDVIPDISDQYTMAFDPGEYLRYWELKMRGLHAFQVCCMLDAVHRIGGKDLVVADIGDSSGNHACYLNALTPKGQISRVISVNLDSVAVEKVRAKGGDAILRRAEELDLGESKVDLFMSFEMVEHLTDPVRFFHGLATCSNARYLLMTVPYQKTSRVGFAQLRSGNPLPSRMTAEDVHIFELSPNDWLLLASFAGWKPVFTKYYLQYPRRSVLRLMAPLWKAIDFEGFWGVLLSRDLSIADRYRDW